MRLAIMLFTALIFARAADARAQKFDPPRTAYAITTLSLRAGPSMDEQVILTLPDSARVRVTRCETLWCAVQYVDREGSTHAGWSVRAFLVFDQAAAAPRSRNCHPSYKGACIPPPPPDIDCSDLSVSVRVTGADPHRLDGDGDGLGCESNRS